MLPRSFGDQKGVLVRLLPKGQQRLVAQKTPTRGNISFVAIICDDTSIQPRLPQVLVGNNHVLRVQDLEAVKASLPANVFLIRSKSCWVDHVLFAQILKWLRAAVSAIDPHIQILLLCDTSPVHLHGLVLKTAKEHRIRLCFVPASCTWLLQPCDTHLFRKFKAVLAELVRQFRVQNGMTHVPLEALILMIIKVIRTVLQGTRWETAFQHNGYDLHQTRVSSRVLNNLEPDVCKRSTSVFPSDDHVRNFLPSRCKVNVGMLIFFALGHMAYTPRPFTTPRRQLDPVRGEAECKVGLGNQDELLFRMSDSPMGSQSAWTGRLRPLPSRVVAAVVSASASQERPPPAYSVSAASSSQPCPSSMSHPMQINSAQQDAVTAARSRPQAPKARAMARARRRM